MPTRYFYSNFYLQPQPPTKFLAPQPLLQQQSHTTKIGSKHSQPQSLSIIPLKQPFLQTHKSKSIISMYKQQLSLPK